MIQSLRFLFAGIVLLLGVACAPSRVVVVNFGDLRSDFALIERGLETQSWSPIGEQRS
jgi:hypothetical protein